MEERKNILVNSMFETYAFSQDYNITMFIDKVYKLSNVLNFLHRSDIMSNGSVAALVSDNLVTQAYFQTACLLTGTNCVIFNSKNYNYFNAADLGVRIIFSFKDLEETPVSNFYPSMIIDVYTNQIYRQHAGLLNFAETFRNFAKNVKPFKLNSTQSIKELSDRFTEECVNPFRDSIVYILNPGSSSISPKISIFYSDQIYQGMLKIADELYHSLKDSNFLSVKRENHLTIDTKILQNENGEVTMPLYTYMLGIFLPLFSNGGFHTESSNKKTNTLYSSTDILIEKFNNIIDDSKVLSFLEKFKIRPLFGFILSRKFKNKYKGVKLMFLHGKTTKKLRSYIRKTGLKVLYLYTMSEVASFISFELYEKFPVKKQPTVGMLPRNLILNSSPSNMEGKAEILISVPDRMACYSHKEFTSVCTMSNKYAGMFSTFDIGSNEKGKLLVHGKADELLYNENGLMIQEQIIYSIILNNNLVRDALIVPVDGVLVLIVEFRTSTLLFNNITVEKAANSLRKNELKEINKKVKPFSKVNNIFVVPEFERVNGKIKISHYLLNEVMKNLEVDE